MLGPNESFEAGRRSNPYVQPPSDVDLWHYQQGQTQARGDRYQESMRKTLDELFDPKESVPSSGRSTGSGEAVLGLLFLLLIGGVVFALWRLATAHTWLEPVSLLVTAPIVFGIWRVFSDSRVWGRSRLFIIVSCFLMVIASICIWIAVCVALFAIQCGGSLC